jgi:methyltransferase-like protein
MADPYEVVPYPSSPFSQAHPDRLAVLATLHGMNPAPVERCRVLELGCGDGGHLIPMAFSFPESEFVGIDRAAGAVARGQAMAAELGLGNLRLQALDLAEFPAEWGPFDYIITHGLYSWVPPEVQDRILSVSKACLAPQGVAYVSYNALPGAHLRLMLREMMLFHLRNIQEPEQRIGQAQALLGWLASAQREGDPYGALLKAEAERTLERCGQFLYHDELAEIYAPLYFHEFSERAARHGLQYLAEASLTELRPREFPPGVIEKLDELTGDPLLREQYLDFLRCRKFRQTLVCHREVALDRDSMPRRVERLYAACEARAVEPRGADGVVEFKGPHGAGMSTRHPLAKAALTCLGEAWPRALAFEELLGRVASKDARALAEILYWSAAAGLVELHACPVRCAARAGERPLASPLARLQLQHGEEVTTLRHTTVTVEGALERELILLLDGTRDRAALLQALSAFAETHAPHPDAAISAAELERALDKLARLALLVG